MLIDDKFLQNTKNEISINFKEGIIEQLTLMKNEIIKNIELKKKWMKEKNNGN